MFQKVKEFISHKHMLSPKDRIVIGVSGGADSVCLFMVLYEISKQEEISLYVVHINHMLRGKEADEDEEFVRKLCKDRNIEFESKRIDVKKLATELGISCEEAGRKARYDTFLEVCQREKCNKLAIAHNKNDSAETFLFHLFRGSNLAGLSGIQPVRNLMGEEVVLIRPLLCVERKEIEDYLEGKGQPYRTDQSNFQDIYTRNLIRNNIMPVAKEVNQNAVSHMECAMESIGEAYEYLLEEAGLAMKDCVSMEHNEAVITLLPFETKPPVLKKLMLRQVLTSLAGSSKDIESKHIMDLLELSKKQVGKRIDLPYGLCAKKDYESLRIFYAKQTNRSKEDTDRKVAIHVPGEYILNEHHKLKVCIQLGISGHEIEKKKYTKWFDYDKIENTLEIRTRCEGDTIAIHNGNKKLKSLFIDAKIPSTERNDILLMADGSNIMWILDDRMMMRISEKHKVTENTQRVLCVELTNVED